MKTRIPKSLKAVLLSAVLFLSLLIPGTAALVAATDEIRNFTITVDVNDDASLEMLYHIEWEVLDDKTYGPLDWIDLGVPNSSHENIQALTDTIDHIEDNGSALAIYLDRSYGANETVLVEFSMTQDRMYQIDKWVEGETVYTFTPAWFDGIDVDHLEIRWNSENAGAWQPDCLLEDGYLTFTQKLSAGDSYTISVVYPNDAFGFSEDRQEGGKEIPMQEEEEEDDIFLILFGLVFLIILIGVPIYLIVKLVRWLGGGTGFGSGSETEKKITRTKIEYYENCPSCGAAREEGKDDCPYCGRSMIKNKEVVEESEIEKPEKYVKNGTYRYGDSPNTFIHVNVINVPVHHTSSTSGTRSSSHHSSCASSCACASHCACASSCACACACASSGRAGCSVKGFFTEAVHEGRIRVESKRMP